MSIQMHEHNSPTSREVYIGNLTLLFSYETLVGFAVPGIGHIKSKNVWGNTTGKHLNGWAAKYVLDREEFAKAEALLDGFLNGSKTRAAMLKGIEKIVGHKEAVYA